MNLKCKACTEFEKEISGMNGFRRTWIDGYTSGKLDGLKDHAKGEPHKKAMRSYKVSVLSLPAEKNQKEIDTSVSQEEIARLKRKANIAYFAAKNEIAFNFTKEIPLKMNQTKK